MTNPTSLEMFAGGGLATVGIRAAGVTPAVAVEWDEAVCQVYADNHGRHILCRPVEEVDYRPYAGVTLAWASPSCKRASQASQGGECAEDLRSADAICRMLREARPQGFILENVRGYQRFESMKRIRAVLCELGYWWNEDILNSASFGVPQTRIRLIVRACLDGVPAPLPTPTTWSGWYGAIEDLIPGLPESRFAEWQLRRLEAQMPETFLVSDQSAAAGEGIQVRQPAEPATTLRAGRQGGYPPRAFIVEGDAAGDRCPTTRESSEPSFVIESSQGGRVHRAFLVDGQQTNGSDASSVAVRHGHRPALTVAASVHKGQPRAWLEAGRVVAMTPRALARFQSLPDSYRLPANRKLACSMIGNGVPCRLAEAAVRSVLEGLS